MEGFKSPSPRKKLLSGFKNAPRCEIEVTKPSPFSPVHFKEEGRRVRSSKRNPRTYRSNYIKDIMNLSEFQGNMAYFLCFPGGQMALTKAFFFVYIIQNRNQDQEPEFVFSLCLPLRVVGSLFLIRIPNSAFRIYT